MLGVSILKLWTVYIAAEAPVAVGGAWWDRQGQGVRCYHADTTQRKPWRLPRADKLWVIAHHRSPHESRDYSSVWLRMTTAHSREHPPLANRSSAAHTRIQWVTLRGACSYSASSWNKHNVYFKVNNTLCADEFNSWQPGRMRSSLIVYRSTGQPPHL